MMTPDFIPLTQQFTCVVNKKIPAPQLMNAVGHLSAGLVYLHKKNSKAMRFRDFVDQSQSVHSSISENGFIVLRAENSNQLRTLRNNLLEKGIPFTDFTSTLVPGNYLDQQQVFDHTPEADLEYYGVCFFAEKEHSRELTKKFSLYVG